MTKKSTIRTVYLYLFSLVGLFLLIISGVRFLDMGMKMFIFTKADVNLYEYYPPYPSVAPERVIDEDDSVREMVMLTEIEKEVLQNWISDYSEWKKRSAEYDPLSSRRQSEASSSLAMIFVGLPLYLYHWRIIKKDAESKE